MLLEVGIKRNFGGAIRTKAHSAQVDFTMYTCISSSVKSQSDLYATTG